MHYLDLFCSAYVFNSDDDQPIVADLTVGYHRESNDLIILLSYTDYEEPEYNCATWAIVKKDEALKLARRLKVSMPGLPRFIYDCMEEWRDIINPSTHDVKGCFKEILDCLVDEKCRYTLRRKYGKSGWTCG